MDAKQEREIEKELREFLLQLAMELEASAAAARQAAEFASDKDRQKAWPHVQQMYTRLSQANHLLQSFQATIDDGLKQVEAEQRQAAKK